VRDRKSPGTASAAALLPLLLAAAAAGCAAPGGEPLPKQAIPFASPVPRGPGEPAAVAAARRASDDALATWAHRLGPLEGHWVAVAGARMLGGTLLAEDAARDLAAAAPPPGHAYFFVAGTEGPATAEVAGLWSRDLAGAGLLAALGLEMEYSPGDGVVVLSRGGLRQEFRSEDGACRVKVLVRAASGLGPAREVDVVLSTGAAAGLVLAAESGAALALHLSEVPGDALVHEGVSGRAFAARRASVRVEIPGIGAAAVIEAFVLRDAPPAREP
jgi:hypothetical protein